jgi:GrpB-like predicted nucleotidyltransferase (UPF0157 family)
MEAAVQAIGPDSSAVAPAAPTWRDRAVRGAAPLAVTAAAANDDAELAASHPAWPARFRVEAEVLRVALGPLGPAIEHVGSTAVPGLAAVPVIDIAIALTQPADIDTYGERLANFGYRLMTDPAYVATDRRVLLRVVRGVRTHHVHVVRAGSDAWHRLVLFRDMLRLDRDMALTYESLKRELARQTRGRPLLYATGKADFIRSVLGRPAFDALAAPSDGAINAPTADPSRR